MPVSGVILAGGLGSRMGGRDKGLITHQGQRLIEHVIRQLSPQVDELLISANRNLAQYRAYGHSIVVDQIPGYPGPLAGMLAGLMSAKHEWVAFTPCDTPQLSSDYVERLLATLATAKKPCKGAFATDGGHQHPTHVLLQKDCVSSLTHFLARDKRKVRQWLKLINAVSVDFSDISESLTNINFPDELV